MVITFKRARIALFVVALANAVVVVAMLPRSSRLTELATMIVCGSSVLLAYREDPACFHRRVGRAEGLRIALVALLMAGGFVLLARLPVL